MRLQNKIPLFVVAVMLLVGTMGGVALLSSQEQTSTHQFEQTASALTAAVSDSLEHDMLTGDRNHIQESLDNLGQNETIKRIDIVSSGNRIWTSSKISMIGNESDLETTHLIESVNGQGVFGESSSGYMTAVKAIPSKNSCLRCHNGIDAASPNTQGNLGAIRMDISTASLEENLSKSREILLIVGGLTFLLVAVTLVWLLRSSVLTPLARLTGAASRITRGDYSARVLVKRPNDEIGAVSSAFNKMANTVEEHTQRLEEANRELDRSSRLKSEFLANMSHELRTPLNVIIGFSEVLRDTPSDQLDEKDRNEFCENIVTSGHHLLELINDVLDLAKVEAGQMKFSPEDFDVSETLTEVMAIMKPLAEKKSLNFKVNISHNISTAYGDVGKFKQVLYNLVGNAIKFTPDGGDVTLSASVMGEKARFSITDTGVGIDLADQTRIFSEFQQVDGSSSRQYEGTGLGLALSRKFVELQGGTIWVESQIGTGSTFFFTLPLRLDGTLPVETPAEHDGNIPDDSKKATARVEKMPAAPVTPADLPKILIVEDDPKTAELIGLWLTREGYGVDFAVDGDEALEKAKFLHPFGICLDIMLPRKDGWQVLHQLKANPSTADIGIIICSALDNPDLGFALGAADYCVKPLNKQLLLNKLKRLQDVTPARRSRPQVMVADSNREAGDQSADMLERQGFSVIRAYNTSEAMDIALEHSPDIIILDMMLQEGSCYDVISFLQKHPVTVDIPVVITTSGDISKQEEERLLGPPVQKIISRDVEAKEQLLGEIFRLEKMNPARALMIDRETGLFNRRYFEKRLAEEINRATRYSLDLSIILIEINDLDGTHPAHQAGLKAISGLLRSNIRAADPLAFLGDDRFGILLPESTRQAGFQVAGKIVGMARGLEIRDDIGNGMTLTVSAAVCDSPGGSVSSDEIISRLEKTLGEIRVRGGNAAQISI